MRQEGAELDQNIALGWANQIELSFQSMLPVLSVRNWFLLATAHVAAAACELFALQESWSIVPRGAICFFGLPLFVRSVRNKMQDSTQRAYFIVFCTLLLPSLFGALALYAVTLSDTTLGYWFSQYFISIFLYFAFFRDQRYPLFASSIVLVICLLVLFSTTHGSGLDLLFYSFWMLAALLTVFWFGILTHQRLTFIGQQKLRAASAVGGKVAHELRTPLMTIRMLAQRIGSTNSKCSADETIDSLARRIESEVDHANTMINILLMTTRPFDQLGPSNDSCDVREVIQRAVQNYPYRNPIERGAVTVISGETFRLAAQETVLTHVLYNLIGNALDFAKDYAEFEVILSLRTSRFRNQIRVSDNGAPIESSVKRQMFDEFYTTKGIDGTGIGLAFCKSAVEQMGGGILFHQSRRGKAFIISFPSRANGAHTSARAQ
ncbi:MAG: HAMP domain-containing sensor histidine kinase [Pseudomonadota bacterium]